MKALTCAFDSMSLPFVTQLYTSTSASDYIDSETWVKTFGTLPLLEWVYLESSALHLFLEALVYKTEAAENSITAYCNVSFPKLRSIYLHSADFSVAFVDTLLDCLMERCDRNAEVQELHLDGSCNVTPDEVERLKEIVVDVIWDGPEKEGSAHMMETP